MPLLKLVHLGETGKRICLLPNAGTGGMAETLSEYADKDTGNFREPMWAFRQMNSLEKRIR
jgi:hypothetical protein